MEEIRDRIHGVKTLKLEVDRVDGDWKETTTRWFALSRMCGHLANRFWRKWQAFHELNDSDSKYQAWLSNKDGKCPVEFFPPGLKEAIDTAGRESCGLANLNGRCAGLLMQAMNNDYFSRKSDKCPKLKRWQAILLSREAAPTMRELLGIRFDNDNGSVVSNGRQITVEISAWRLPREGMRASGVRDVIHIKDSTKRDKQQLKLAQKLASGEWTPKGSILRYDESTRKWFVHLCYTIPKERHDLDDSRTAYLIPGRNVPFYIRERGKRSVWLQARGQHIEGIRTGLALERMQRSANYRLASLRKGHGRKSATKWRATSSRKWSNFVRRINHGTSHRAIKFCIDNGIRNLVYFKPNAVCAENRNVSGKLKTSSWEFHNLGEMLKNKGQHVGVVVKIEECGKTVTPKAKQEEKPKVKRGKTKQVQPV